MGYTGPLLLGFWCKVSTLQLCHMALHNCECQRSSLFRHMHAWGRSIMAGNFNMLDGQCFPGVAVCWTNGSSGACSVRNKVAIDIYGSLASEVHFGSTSMSCDLPYRGVVFTQDRVWHAGQPYVSLNPRSHVHHLLVVTRGAWYNC